MLLQEINYLSDANKKKNVLTLIYVSSQSLHTKYLYEVFLFPFS